MSNARPAPGASAGAEPRWPAVVTIVALLFLLSGTQHRVRLFPEWVAPLIALAVLAPLVAVWLGGPRRWWLRAENAAMKILFFLTVPAMLATEGYLVIAMVHGTAQIDALRLFLSSTSLWVTNVLIFGLLYWHVDRGGPDARRREGAPRPDWMFPQYELPAEFVFPGWRPAFIDYLYLSLSTATAFSTTEVTPITARAKALMMVEITISLVTLVVVGARAINILVS